MTTTPNYSLLRPFDAEAAKRGEPICYATSTTCVEREYVAGPDAKGCICVKYPTGYFDVCAANQYKMMALAWVEGKPVYKGDVLYPTLGSKDEFRVTGFVDGCLVATNWHFNPSALTWNPPKVKRERWINIYPQQTSAFMYPTKYEANYHASDNRIACVCLEWDE